MKNVTKLNLKNRILSLFAFMLSNTFEVAVGMNDVVQDVERIEQDIVKKANNPVNSALMFGGAGTLAGVTACYLYSQSGNKKLQQEAQNAEKEVKKKEEAIKTIQEKCNLLQRMSENKDNQITSLEEKELEKRLALDNQLNEYEEIVKNIKNEEAMIKTQQTMAQETGITEERKQRLLDNIQEKEAICLQLKNQLDILKEQAQTGEITDTNYKLIITLLREQYDTLSSKKNELKQTIDNLAVEVEEKNNELKEKEREQDVLKQEKLEQDERIKQLAENIESLEVFTLPYNLNLVQNTLHHLSKNVEWDLGEHMGQENSEKEAEDKKKYTDTFSRLLASLPENNKKKGTKKTLGKTIAELHKESLELEERHKNEEDGLLAGIQEKNAEIEEIKVRIEEELSKDGSGDDIDELEERKKALEKENLELEIKLDKVRLNFFRDIKSSYQAQEEELTKLANTKELSGDVQHTILNCQDLLKNKKVKIVNEIRFLATNCSGALHDKLSLFSHHGILGMHPNDVMSLSERDNLCFSIRISLDYINMLEGIAPIVDQEYDKELYKILNTSNNLKDELEKMNMYYTFTLLSLYGLEDINTIDYNNRNAVLREIIKLAIPAEISVLLINCLIDTLLKEEDWSKIQKYVTGHHRNVLVLDSETTEIIDYIKNNKANAEKNNLNLEEQTTIALWKYFREEDEEQIAFEPQEVITLIIKYYTTKEDIKQLLNLLNTFRNTNISIERKIQLFTDLISSLYDSKPQKGTQEYEKYKEIFITLNNIVDKLNKEQLDHMVKKAPIANLIDALVETLEQIVKKNITNLKKYCEDLKSNELYTNNDSLIKVIDNLSQLAAEADRDAGNNKKIVDEIVDGLNNIKYIFVDMIARIGEPSKESTISGEAMKKSETNFFPTWVKYFASTQQDITSTQERIAALEKEITAIKNNKTGTPEEEKDILELLKIQQNKLNNKLNELNKLNESAAEMVDLLASNYPYSLYATYLAADAGKQGEVIGVINDYNNQTTNHSKEELLPNFYLHMYDAMKHSKTHDNREFINKFVKSRLAQSDTLLNYFEEGIEILAANLPKPKTLLKNQKTT